jgi:hypothetical protein
MSSVSSVLGSGKQSFVVTSFSFLVICSEMEVLVFVPDENNGR